MLGVWAGAIFDSRDMESQRAFEYGIMQHRQNPLREPYFRFNVTMDTVDTADTFQVASASKELFFVVVVVVVMVVVVFACY